MEIGNWSVKNEGEGKAKGGKKKQYLIVPFLVFNEILRKIQLSGEPTPRKLGLNKSLDWVSKEMHGPSYSPAPGQYHRVCAEARLGDTAQQLLYACATRCFWTTTTQLHNLTSNVSVQLCSSPLFFLFACFCMQLGDIYIFSKYTITLALAAVFSRAKMKNKHNVLLELNKKLWNTNTSGTKRLTFFN